MALASLKPIQKENILNFLLLDTSNIEQFKQQLKAHQQGETDYLTFCNNAAESGVEKWKVDTDKMTCIYYDKSGNKMLQEKIPS